MIAALVLGVLIGVTLGALGGGGSILAVPALVYVVGEGAAAATTASLVIVGLAAVSAMAGHARAGNVRWGAGVVFAALGVAASVVGTALNQHLDPQALLLGFAVVMLLAAAGMVRTSRRPVAPPVVPQLALVSAGAAATPGTDVAAANEPVRPAGVRVGRLVAASLVVGFLTGLFGVGGGFVIVPALVMALGFEMPVAVGTSLLVIAINSAVALAARAGHESLHWSVIVPVTVAAVVGSLAGKQVADRVAGATMTRAFAGLLVAVAAYTAIRSGIALAA